MRENLKVKSKKARTRIKIMHAAKGLFEEKGLGNVTFNDIAEEADMCRTTIFNHFSNTEELMISLCEQEVEDIESYCENLEVKGVRLVEELFNKLIEDTACYPVLTTKLTNSSILGGGNQKPITRVEKLIEDNLTHEYKNKAFNEESYNSIELTVLLMGAYYGLINHYHLNNKRFEIHKLQKEFKKLFQLILGGEENE